MSLTEIEKAVDALSPDELAKLAAYIARHDKQAWDEQLERDFSTGGKHAKTIQKIDAEIEGKISRRCRDIARASNFLEVLSPATAFLPNRSPLTDHQSPFTLPAPPWPLPFGLQWIARGLLSFKI
jgi:hypothetical protein